MSKDRLYKKNNKLSKHETSDCYKCDGKGDERWLLFFHRECSLCCGTGKREYFEPENNYEAGQLLQTSGITRKPVVPERKQIRSNIGSLCSVCNGTGIQRFTEKIAQYGALSVSSGYGLQRIVHTSCCTYCQGTGKS